jgi:hypothetical protein
MSLIVVNNVSVVLLLSYKACCRRAGFVSDNKTQKLSVYCQELPCWSHFFTEYNMFPVTTPVVNNVHISVVILFLLKKACCRMAIFRSNTSIQMLSVTMIVKNLHAFQSTTCFLPLAQEVTPNCKHKTSGCESIQAGSTSLCQSTHFYPRWGHPSSDVMSPDINIFTCVFSHQKSRFLLKW